MQVKFKCFSILRNKIYCQIFLTLSCFPVVAQTVVQIPSMRGSWELTVPINLYCKMESRLGYFRSDRGWGPLRFPIDQESDFTFKLKDWKNLSAEELKNCNLHEDKLSKPERDRNWKMCGIVSYPSVSTQIYTSLCVPQKTTDGRVTLKCDDDIRVDVDDGVFMQHSGDFGYILNGVSAVSLSRCKKVN